MRLIYCGWNNPRFADAAVSAGWLYGARLPATVYAPLWFADQDWRRPDRAAYMTALARYRPAVATVLDLERQEQLAEVLSWAEEAAQYASEAVVVIPKVSGGLGRIPERIGGLEVRLGFSVPTKHGATPVPCWEFGRRPVHLLGGSPQKQMDLARYLNVVSADSNMMLQQAHRCRFWSRRKGSNGHWVQLRDSGDHRHACVGPGQARDANLAAFRLSLVEIRRAWEDMV